MENFTDLTKVAQLTSGKAKTKEYILHREQICVCQGGMGWERGWSGRSGLADVSYYMEWINNKVLLYSTGNYIQYPVINNNKKYF